MFYFFVTKIDVKMLLGYSLPLSALRIHLLGARVPLSASRSAAQPCRVIRVGRQPDIAEAVRSHQVFASVMQSLPQSPQALVHETCGRAPVLTASVRLPAPQMSK